MRRLMSVALIGFAVAATSTVAAAQAAGRVQAGRAGVVGAVSSDSTHRSRGGMGGRGRAALAGLDLTAAQKTDIKAINKKYSDQVKVLRQANGKQSGPPTPEVRDQMRSLMERERAETRAVLTPAQQTKFDANLAKAGKGKGKHNGGLRRT